MSQPFDPYEKWFGISPQDRPVNHYQLLGLKLFEPNLKLIRAAGEKRVEFLQDVSSGKYVDVAQKCLNEVAKAVLCLTNPAKKLAYDRDLKVAMRASQTASTPVTPATSPNIAATSPTSPTGSTPGPPVLVPASSKPSRSAEFAIDANANSAATHTAAKSAKPAKTGSLTAEADDPESGAAKDYTWLIKPAISAVLVITIASLLAFLLTRDGKESETTKGSGNGSKGSNSEVVYDENWTYPGTEDKSNKSKPSSKKSSNAPSSVGPIKLYAGQKQKLDNAKGQQVQLQGVVETFRTSGSEKTIYLDFAAKNGSGATVYMYRSKVGQDWTLPIVEQKFNGKKLLVNGKAKTIPGGNRVGIEVTKKEQIKLFDEQ